TVVLASASVVAGPALAVPGKRPPKPSTLWRQYPLGTTPLTGTTPTNPVRPPALPPGMIPPPARSTGFPVAVVLGAGAGLVAAAGLAAVLVRSRRDEEERALDVSLETIANAAARLESRRRARGIEAGRRAWDNWTSATRRRAVSDQLDQRVEPE